MHYIHVHVAAFSGHVLFLLIPVVKGLIIIIIKYLMAEYSVLLIRHLILAWHKSSKLRKSPVDDCNCSEGNDV